MFQTSNSTSLQFLVCLYIYHHLLKTRKAKEPWWLEFLTTPYFVKPLSLSKACCPQYCFWCVKLFKLKCFLDIGDGEQRCKITAVDVSVEVLRVYLFFCPRQWKNYFVYRWCYCFPIDATFFTVKEAVFSIIYGSCFFLFIHVTSVQTFPVFKYELKRRSDMLGHFLTVRQFPAE